MTTYVVRKAKVTGKPNLEQFEAFIRRTGDLGRRFVEGSLNPGLVTDTLQRVLEGLMIVEEQHGVASSQVAIPPVVKLATLIPLNPSIPLAAHAARPMSQLFRNRDKVVFNHRDGDLDRWFTVNSPECPAGTATLVKTPKVMTFRQMAQSATGLATESIADLSRAIVAKGMDITPAKWDDAIDATQNGADILLTSGFASFAFAKTGNKFREEKDEEYDEVVMLYARHYEVGQWDAHVFRLDLYNSWPADDRLLLRNSS